MIEIRLATPDLFEEKEILGARSGPAFLIAITNVYRTPFSDPEDGDSDGEPFLVEDIQERLGHYVPKEPDPTRALVLDESRFVAALARGVPANENLVRLIALVRESARYRAPATRRKGRRKEKRNHGDDGPLVEDEEEGG
jgi:hypothetical protein